ncbi:MAG: arsenosugar biosynthesis radical SAM (seleno)protein ArsS [Thermodesulfovibrionales bacterium]
MEFKDRIDGLQGGALTPVGLKSLQVNLGYRCNMACSHCHVSAGPGRTEVMTKDTIDLILSLLREERIGTLDITGGAPELNPHFQYLLQEAKKAGCHVIVHSNLTVFFEPGLEHLPEFYQDHDAEITASLPCYLDSGVDSARGKGTYHKSIGALRHLNRLGYGDGKAGRRLNLVYNPSGPFLPPEQKRLEDDYRRELAARQGITFDRLFVFANMPVGRFRDQLERAGALKQYCDLLEQAFNPSTLPGLMCRHLISVGWDGTLFDCDFNQGLGLSLQHIRDFDRDRLAGREILTGSHCYGCTAGQGST